VPVHEGPRSPRVLLGNLEPVVRLGMTMVLEEGGVEIVGAEERPHALVLLAGRLQPDAVVLDLEQPVSRDLGDRVRLASPDTTVIFWTRDEDVMEVLDPGVSEPRRHHESVSEELCNELVRSQVNRVER
jgi:DNA-binding NarL/FixJ family response regulator